jgi:hypothetical protein
VTLADVENFDGEGLLAWVRSLFAARKLSAPTSKSAAALSKHNGLVLYDTFRYTELGRLAPVLGQKYKLSEIQALSMAAALRKLAESAPPAAHTGGLSVYFSALRCTKSYLLAAAPLAPPAPQAPQRELILLFCSYLFATSVSACTCMLLRGCFHGSSQRSCNTNSHDPDEGYSSIARHRKLDAQLEGANCAN